MYSASPTHIRYLPTGDIARIIGPPPDPSSSLKWATLKCEFVDGRQMEISRINCTVLVTAAEIAEYQRVRSLWHTLTYFNPPPPDPPSRSV